MRHILVFNSGSSSLKFKLYDASDSPRYTLLAAGAVSAFGPTAQFNHTANGRREQEEVGLDSYHDAAIRILEWLTQFTGAHSPLTITAVGHRVVHGGNLYQRPVLISEQILEQINAANALAPLHNLASVEVIRAARAQLGFDIPMVAVFDTAFHHDLPERARRYAIPHTWADEYKIRRYGFHGIAHRYMYERYMELGGVQQAHKVITIQLGQGCSMAAIRDGISIDTTMGFTPLEGLVMGTRPGDLDPGVLLHLAAQGLTNRVLNDAFNHDSGLLGLSGISSDMRVLLELSEQGNTAAQFTVEAFCYRARKYLGAYLAALGGADAVIFGGGIAEFSSVIRERVCSEMQWCGLILDSTANQMAIAKEALISASESRIAVHVLPVDEELIIVRDTSDYLHSLSAHTSAESQP